MQCPKCGKEAISKLKFYFTVSLFQTKCSNCDTKLKPDQFLKRYQQGTVILGIIVGITVSNMGLNFTSIILILALISILLIPLELWAWRKGEYLEA